MLHNLGYCYLVVSFKQVATRTITRVQNELLSIGDQQVETGKCLLTVKSRYCKHQWPLFDDQISPKLPRMSTSRKRAWFDKIDQNLAKKPSLIPNLKGLEFPVLANRYRCGQFKSYRYIKYIKVTSLAAWDEFLEMSVQEFCKLVPRHSNVVVAAPSGKFRKRWIDLLSVLVDD